MKIKPITSLATAIGCIALAVPQAQAAAVLSLTDQGGNNWNLQFQGLVFTSTVSDSGANFDWIIFENFFNSNASVSSGTPAQTISANLNSSPVQQISLNNVNGTFNSTLGGLDPNDLIVNFAIDGLDSIGPIGIGDTVTLSGNIVIPNMSSVPGFTVPSTVNATIWSTGTSGAMQTNTIPVSVVAAIPEPSITALIGLGALAFAFRRRK